ncbi:glycosyltransferase family 2 protein [Rhizobium sp.]|jgi:cellulose synthase/poly-beta-1,6-N-acetylglucosamine synthase-like glycosyltransferase|uniref:glycosyltransferase family 2 protein n=1 Tax=Rhizobium sp. TaxID=391 RepID=UPI000E9E032B|nr:hypothetical protein [Rhizobium sp.]
MNDQLIAIDRVTMDSALAYTTAFTFLSAILIAVTMRIPYKTLWKDQLETVQICLTISGAALIGLLWGNMPLILTLSTCTFFASMILRDVMPSLSTAGLTYMVSGPLSMIVGGIWSCVWLHEAHYPDWALVGFCIFWVFAAFKAVLVLAMRLGTLGIVLRKKWKRPITPFNPISRTQQPRVSIHVPCHAEPPDVVIETLNHLAALDYDNVEILVCDNNTLDPLLWQPVEHHCAHLNDRVEQKHFRFFHVENMQGAKAGALNFCLDQTDPNATLVALVDADYQAEPDFLSALVSFFQDEKFAFVQTSHDYRCDDENFYKDACYWEYVSPNRSEYAGVSELKASFTVGTMCIFRKSAIEEVGRWAEWCQTEDSEIAIRLRAAGYDGIFLPHTFGRGLIPDNFFDWKRQRFRWTSGPMQQFLHHWRLFMPNRLGGSPHLTAWGKVFEIFRSLVPLTISANILTFSAMALLMPPLIATGILPQLSMPTIGWTILVATFLAGAIRSATEYWACGCRSFRSMLGAEFAAYALTYVCSVSAMAALIGQKIIWHRTPKFDARLTWLQAIRSASPEIRAAMVITALLLYVLAFSSFIGTASTVLIATPLLYPLGGFLASAIMAVLATRRHPVKISRPFPDGRPFASHNRLLWSAANVNTDMATEQKTPSSSIIANVESAPIPI